VFLESSLRTQSLRAAQKRLVPTAVATDARGPQVGQRIAAAVGDRDEMVHIDGGRTASPAIAAVAGEDLPPKLL
jgi:hypothetical protein